MGSILNYLVVALATDVGVSVVDPFKNIFPRLPLALALPNSLYLLLKRNVGREKKVVPGTTF